MDFIRSVFILFLIATALTLNSVHALSGILMKSNGCGSTFTIDWALNGVGEEVIIPCCNAHDNCYDTCGKSRSECDNAFQSCLSSVCSQLNGNGFKWLITLRRTACQRDGKILFHIVDAFGSSAYNNAQSSCAQ